MIKGITFDMQSISAANMAHFMRIFSGGRNGVTRGCEITHDDNNLYISEGYCLIQGRLIEISGTESVPLQTVSTGGLYCLVVFRIDLSQVNTEEDFQQGTIETRTSSAGYPEPSQSDLEDNPAGVFELPLARYHVTSEGLEEASFTSLAEQISASESFTSDDFNTLFNARFTLDGSDLYITSAGGDQ